MTSSTAAMDDDAIYAFNPKPVDRAGGSGKNAAPAPPRRRRWPWVLLTLALIVLAAALSLALLLLGLLDAASNQVQVTINGEPWQVLAPGSQPGWLALFGVAVAALVVAVVVPLAVLLALLAAALGIGVALLAVALVAAIALSPLWLAVLLLWLALRPRRTSAPGGLASAAQ